ncbi:MAG: insulinase family protein [Bryobacterales bacterium]|nr:insulinase family protein [Bryobacterales bacterium]
MKRRSVLLFSFLGLLAQAADVTIPIEKYTLPNGMRVVLSKDNAVPVVAVYMIYNVGARTEEKGRTGFAHLFEHMMFEGSANAPKGIHSKLVKSNGGSDNGSTHPDYTDYFETLPSNKLAVALWLESDRMRSLAVTAENLTNQKEAVKQERRLSFDNRPYATAIVDKWPQLAYGNWQSSHSLIGSFEDLNAASLDDVAKFFKTYYAPNNAALVIVGDIQIPPAKKLVSDYFGDIASQPQPKHPDLREPAKAEVKTEIYKDKLAQVPGVIAGYPGPPRRSPDYYALGMLDVLLTGGESSRLHLDLVKGKQSVVQFEANPGWPFADTSDYKDPGIYALFLLYKPNFKSGEIVSQLQDEIARVQKDGVEAKELERMRTFFRAQRIGTLQNALTRAQLLGKYEILDGHPEVINTEMDKFLAVTPAQIQAVAKKYLSPAKRDVLEIQPAPEAK